MIGDLVAGDVPFCDVDVVGVAEGGEIGHFDGAAIWVFALGEELVDRVDGVGLDGVVAILGRRRSDTHTGKKRGALTR